MKTNVIKLQFLKNGEPQGREYTYFAPEGAELAPGDIVAIEVTKGIITAVDVPVEEIAPFADKAKTIIGPWLELEPIKPAEISDSTESIIQEYMNNPARIVEQLASCCYKHIGGPLVNNIAFMALHRLFSPEDNDVPFSGI